MNAVWGKRFESGMYGGKFLPYHRGHLYCLEVASRMCRHVWQLLMVNGADEERILLQMAPEEREKYTPEKRFARWICANVGHRTERKTGMRKRRWF